LCCRFIYGQTTAKLGQTRGKGKKFARFSAGAAEGRLYKSPYLPYKAGFSSVLTAGAFYA